MAENKEEKKASSGWAAVITTALSLISYIIKLICGKSNNPEITKAERNKKIQKVLDDNKKAIKKAHETNNLDEIRKMVGK